MEWLINRRRMMCHESLPPVYLTFEDTEAWRLSCINWGDYDETVITAGDNNTVNIVVTFKSKLNNVIKKSVITSVRENVDNTEGIYVEGTTVEPIGITQKQCDAVTSWGTVFRYTTAVSLNDLAKFGNVTSLSNYAFADSPNLYSIILPSKITAVNNSYGMYCINNCPNLKTLKTLSTAFTVSATMCSVAQGIVWFCNAVPSNVGNYQDNLYVLNTSLQENPLPSNYTRKQYIETNRASYIDTGLTALNSIGILTDLEVEQYLTAVNNNLRKGVISATTDSTRFYTMFSNTINRLFLVTSSSTAWSAFIDIAFDSKSRFYLNKFSYSMSYQNTRKRDKSQSGTLGNLYIGGNAAGPCGWHNLKFGEMFIVQGNELVLHYIPCTNDSGVYGMWDAINGVFVGSCTETPFTGA